MIHPARLLRLFYINRILLRHRLDDLLLTIPFFKPFHFLRYLLPWQWFRAEDTRGRGERIRCTLEDLGPIFVKFGQNLSTRRDLLPDDIADELTLLLDKVPPFPGKEAQAIIEKALGEPITKNFSYFEVAPMASASIAQVHAARLHNGTNVVIKVLRPGIEKTIRHDIALMYILAEMAERYWKDGRRLRPVEVVAEYEKTILDELDLMREAANASQLRRNFSDSSLLYIPEIYWPYTRKNVMVMERISGIPVGHINELKRQNVNLQKLSELGVEIFFTQVFRDNFFHADMHPGNIFVSPEGQYIAVDFGIMGTLSPKDQHYLAENFIAFFNRDYFRVAELHVQSEWVPSGTRIDEFESAIRSVCEPIFEKPLKEISFGHLLLRLFQTARRFNMEVQPQLVLLQKTLLNIEGLGRELYPELDLWKTAKPYLEGWMKKQIGPQAFLKDFKENWPMWSEKLPRLPIMAYEVLNQMQTGHFKMQGEVRQIQQLQKEIREGHRHTYGAIIGAALLISAAIIYVMSEHSVSEVMGVPLLSWVLFVMAVVTWISCRTPSRQG
ncbi:MAG: ubiquinone biosynthesis regulatory protein kinase UbiB [Gammaproteobacteria bacterium]|nr:ubiquinone biosynthesis regulatory protein kinase UbiB [Gammaproteobacteria bacterium]